ncbi:glycosyltransferase [Coleofasciculus sp. FACHB-1120]|uniref:glycosyltransferase n=1 Tax=Coleofasciculus sp. FACHB-1120 TaxID=2692783 RepID=UPI0016862A96|nr:glycosyltransferase [Coleofasciculus sp. FACHB-1120]MBD2740771.1 glycosyltransferase [Coleofasciculus sp. FACHB-1120]
MRVAMIVGRFPVLSETFVLNQVTGLIDRGHEVDIYTEAPGETAKMHPNVEKYQLLERTQCMGMPLNRFLRLLKGIWLFSINYQKNPALLMQSLNVFKYGKDAASLRLLYAVVSALPSLDNGTYDIVHCQFGTFGFLGLAFRIMTAPKGKLIVSFRGYDISWYLQWAGDDVYNRLFKVVDVCLPNCDYFKQRLIKLGADENKIVIMRSGIDCSKFIFTTRHLPTDGHIRIVTTGRLVEKKGLEYGIRAVAKLITLHPNIEYNIIGDGPLGEDLQQLIQELNVGETVKLLGRMQQQELIKILDNSHIFIAPCVTATNGDQDAPVNVLKEAMAMGLPVIGTQHGGIPELIEDGISGFLVPERDADTLAEKLGYLIEHSEIWPEMGRAGRAYVEKHYDLNKLNDLLVETYQ